MKFSKTLLCGALSLAMSFAVSSAQAASSASAVLSFSVLSAGGFAWSADPSLPSYASSEATAADLTGFTESAGVFSPAYGPASTDSHLVVGTGVPATSASSSGTTTVANAQTFASPSMMFNSLSAFALVPTQGQASATAFGRSYFTLNAGSAVTFQGSLSVTFQGSLFLGAVGFNPAAPANYNVSDFYGFAAGFLQVDGGSLVDKQIGGTPVVGAYNLTDASTLSLTYTNTTSAPITTYLDSGASVYSASALAPIPEPGTYVMLLAGLLAMGFVAVRRQSHE